MIKGKATQSGFAITQTLVIVAVVVIIGIIGGLVYKHNNTNTVNSATSSKTQTEQQQAASNNSQTAQQAQQYLVIKEWGVQLPLSDSIKDAYYVPSTGSRGFDGIVNEMYIGVKSLDASGCAADGNGGNHDGKLSAPAMIFRAKPTEVDPVTNKTYPQEYPDGVTLDGYFYAYQRVADPNRTDCKAPTATLQEVNSAIASAAKNITATAR